MRFRSLLPFGLSAIAVALISTPVRADLFGCTTTSVVAFRGGEPEHLTGRGDIFTFSTTSAIQRYTLPDTPAARFGGPKGHAYAQRFEAAKGDPAKSKAVVDEMMRDKAAEAGPLEFEFNILSSPSALSMSAASKSCLPGTNLCFGRFLTIRLPGDVILQGKPLKIPVPAGTFILVEGNMLTVATGNCEKIN